jgi:anti-anti-sigma regulatory factor
MDAGESTALYKFGEKIFITNADALTKACDGHFIDEKVRTIVFDLVNVQICDLYGLRFLINAQRKAAASDKRLLLYRPDVKLSSMLAQAKLRHIFTLVDTMPY